MRTITPALEALLRSRFQAAGSGYAARFEVDGAAYPSGPSTSLDWRTLQLSWSGGALNAEPAGWTLAGFDDSSWSVARLLVSAGALADIPRATAITCDAEPDGHVAKAIWIARYEFELDALPGHDVPLVHNADNTATWYLNGTAVASTPDFSWDDILTTIVDGDLLVLGTNCLAVKVSQDLSVTDNSWSTNPTHAQALLELTSSADLLLSMRPKGVGVNRNLRMGPDQLDVELANEDIDLGFGPTSIFPTNSRCRLYEWYGDPANAVLTFTGVIDKVNDSRDPLTTVVTCRSMAGPILVDQTFSTIGPQEADNEEDEVRTHENGVYEDMEVSDIALDILERAGWPADSIDVADTSFVLDAFLREDGESGWDSLARLAAFVGYSLWDDEDGVVHFRTLGDEAGVDEPLVADYEYLVGAGL